MEALKEKELFHDIMSAKYSPRRLVLKYGLTEQEFCRLYDDFRKNGQIPAVIDWTWKRQGHLVECAGRSSLGTIDETPEAESNSKSQDFALGRHANFVRILGGVPRFLVRAVARLFNRVA